MSKKKKFKKILVLIDGENVGPSENLKTVFTNLEHTGKKVVFRIYGDWISSGISNWNENVREFNMETVNQINLVRGKSLCDMRMIIDAVDAIHDSDFDTFVIVSADSDFEPLCSKLHEKEKTVVIMSDHLSIVPKYAASGDYYVDLKNGACLKPKQLKTKKEQKLFKYLQTDIRVGDYTEDEEILFEKARKAYESISKKERKEDDGFVSLTAFGQAFSALGGKQGYRELGCKFLRTYLKKYPAFYEIKGQEPEMRMRIRA